MGCCSEGVSPLLQAIAAMVRAATIFIPTSTGDSFFGQNGSRTVYSPNRLNDPVHGLHRTGRRCMAQRTYSLNEISPTGGGSLRRQIVEIGADAGADAIAVAFYDYTHRTGWSYHAERWFHAASTIKVPVLLGVFAAI